MAKNLFWVIFGLFVTLAGAIQSFKKGVPWGVLFLILWLGFFVYGLRHYRKAKLPNV
jgi:hypothetical protein